MLPGQGHVRTGTPRPQAERRLRIEEGVPLPTVWLGQPTFELQE
jgi:hypothetical protein